MTSSSPDSALVSSPVKGCMSLGSGAGRIDFLFWGLLILHLAPVWLLPYFPSQDGPNHLYGANLLRLLLLSKGSAGPALGPLLGQFYTLNLQPFPNWLGHALLAPLLGVTGPVLAEKILLSLYLAGLPLAARALLRAVRPGRAPLAVVVFPLLLNWPFYMGFYNYVLGLALLLATLAVWVHGQRDPRLCRALGLAALALMLYFAHIVALVLALAAVGAWTFVRSWRAWRTGHGRELWRGWAFTLAGFLPASVLAALAVAKLGSAASSGLLPAGPPLLFRLSRLLTLDDAMVSFDAREAALARLLAGGLLVAALAIVAGRRARWRARRADLLLVAALVWLGAYCLAPVGLGQGGYLIQRLALVPYLALALWVGACVPGQRGRLALKTFAASLSLAFLVFGVTRQVEIGRDLREYESVAPAIRPGSVILPLCLAPAGTRADGSRQAYKIQPFVHASARLALARQSLDLSDYESATDYFPTRFRPEADPARLLGSFELQWGLARMDFSRFQAQTGRRIDAVLVFDDGQGRLEWPEFAGLRRQLDAGYRLVARSRPRGLLRVYAPRP